MSHIRFDQGYGPPVLISGAERANIGSILSRLADTSEGYVDTSDDVAFGTLLDAATTACPEAMFLARLHGQCEIHCYVEGENRLWLARLIARTMLRTVRLTRDGRTGREDLLRAGMSLHEQVPNEAVLAASGETFIPQSGWLALIAFLSRRGPAEGMPVVCSYSVTATFPAGFPSDLPEHLTAARFFEALAKLRERADVLELRPEGWADYRFRR